MYTPTQNYGLAMPSYGDEADIGVINDMVTAQVDELLFQNRTISAPPFETTEAYTEGDLVVYENVLYRFTANKAAGAWDSSKVVQTSLAAEIESKGSGGASSLSDLTDTDIDTPVVGDVLTWDGTAWVNAEGTPTVTKTATGNPIEITDGAAAPLVKCVTQITGYQSGSGTPSPDNIRPIVAYTEGEIEVSDGDGNTTTHTTTFPSAIYRGSEDVVNGEVTSEKVILTLNTADMNNSDSYPGWSNSGLAALIGHGVSTRIDNAIMNIGLSYSINTLGYNDILFLDKTIYGKTQSEWIALAIDVQIVIDLPTPTTSSVTPTNLPIKSLAGYSHIESTTGEMEVEYITQGYQPLVDLIDEAAEQREAYSTDEQEIGTWVDGSKLYQKTYTFSGTGAANPYSTTVDMTGKTVTNVIPHYAKYTYGGGTVGYCVGSRLTANNSNVLTVQYNDEAPPTLDVIANLGGSTETYEVCFTLQYVKTSSNNRSLSKGATDSLRAEISGVKGEGEELTETDEKAVKKAQSESIETKEEADETEENADEVQSETVTE